MTLNIQDIDYKDVEIIKQFTDTHGRLVSKRKTGISAKNQRRVENAIKRARFMGFLPYINQ